MSAPLVRAATAGSLALALAFALPAAAFAESDEERGKSSSTQQQSEDRGKGKGGDRSGQGQGAEEGKGSQQDEPKKGKGSQQGSQQGKDKSQSGNRTSSGGSEGRASGGDPRGNNGTVKIDGEPFDDGRGNEPHVGCVFQVDFYGFDAGDTATITFTGHAPTGGGLLHSQSGTVISDDAAGGGQDRDATLTFSVQNQLSELLSVAPHPKQGWHVKLAVDVDSAPGGAKQKVFWIDCPQPATTTGGTTANPATGGGGTTTQVPTTTAQGGGTSTVLPATVVTGTTVAAAEREEMTFGSGTTTLAAAGVTQAAAGAVAGAAVGEAAAGAGSGSLRAQGSVLPASLPFTGSQALLYLLGLGLTTVAVGAIAHRMGRQQADLG